MTWHPRGALRWLYPGMRVKRWLALAFVSMGALTLALLYAFGIDLMRFLYRSFPLAQPLRYALAAVAIAVSVAAFLYAILRLVRSVARGVAPSSHEKMAAAVYRTRVLERAPRVVAIGGGTGLSTLLRGLKRVTANLSAIVTVTDDGGSSGRLRDEIDILPPGDVRNCLLALAEDESQLSDYFQHRFPSPPELAGHSLGNLILVGLEQATGSFDRAIEAMSYFLNVRGRVLPATLTKTHLVARFADGAVVEGESRIAQEGRRIERVWLSTSPVPAYDRALAAIAEADLIVLGPGSLFTSLVPNLLVDSIADALERSGAEKALVANLMTQPGETTGFSLSDHLRALDGYIPLRSFDLLIVNSARPTEPLLAGYRSEAAEPVVDDLPTPNSYGLTVVRQDLIGVADLAGKTTVKHDPDKLARALVHNARTFARRAGAEELDDV
jgi:uncharacterized cofD-like protein